MSEEQDNFENNSRFNSVVFAILCGVLFFTTLAFGAVDTWALGVLSLVSALIIFLWFIDAWQRKGFIFSSNAIQLPIIGLILIGLIQLLPLRSFSYPSELLSAAPTGSLSLAPFQTQLAIVQLTVYLVFLAAAYFALNTSKRLSKIVYIVTVFGALMAFFGILQRLANPDQMIYGLRQSLQANPFGSFVNQHHFAAFMEMTIALPLALLFGRATKKERSVLLLIAAVIMGMAVFFTSSRGGVLSLLGVFGFIITANILKKRRDFDDGSTEQKDKNYRKNFVMIGGGLALMIVIFGIVLFLANDSTINRVITMQTGSDDISNGRTHFWSIALQIFKDYPILGSGLDSYGMAFPSYDTWNGAYRLERAHNDYLQILSDAGIAGFICIAAFVYLLFRQGLRVIEKAESRFRRSVAIGALAGCFGVLIHSFFDFPLRTPSNSFFFLLLTVLATASVRHSKSDDAVKKPVSRKRKKKLLEN